jgi:hypothetical protein
VGCCRLFRLHVYRRLLHLATDGSGRILPTHRHNSRISTCADATVPRPHYRRHPRKYRRFRHRRFCFPLLCKKTLSAGIIPTPSGGKTPATAASAHRSRHYRPMKRFTDCRISARDNKEKNRRIPRAEKQFRPAPD